ncbi:Integrator complex subunit 6-A [Armadillidium nasatum]|uniref:Integrator complex subunit 6-A n=1 Tax=Armadillidium nasatum TaxID=96803 RepID=A0A5N5TP21_9CRUS|nr:Integrator complex subunit 6-A [Armadillidium nasatum]
MSANHSGGILGASSPGWNGNGSSNGSSFQPSYSAPQQQQQQQTTTTTTTQQLINNSSNSLLSSNSWHNCRKMIYVPRPTHRGSHGCFWPIPESYWPDSNLLSLPARTAHPNLKFTCTSQEPMVIDNLPFDKYELEPSPLTQYILSRKQPTVCWQVFIANSSKHSDVGHPFGYLKASTTKPCVNLFVMPYNYPVLLPLLDDLFKTHRLKPAKEWRQQFENYLRTMPPYYASPLKRALERMGVSNIFPDKFDSSLSYLVMNQLKKLKNQAKVEYEKICGEVEKRVNQNMNNSSNSLSCNTASVTTSNLHEGIKVKSRKHLNKMSQLRDQVTEYKNFTIAVKDTEIQPQMYRNPFDIGRSQLIDQLARMRANFLQHSFSDLLTDRGQDQLHCKPISQMGNYQDYLKKMNPPLRELESAPVRQHMFGNPFKIDKRMSMMVDEADVDLMGTGGGQAGGATRDERGDIALHSPLQHGQHSHYPMLPASPLPHLPEGAPSPHLRQDPISPISSLPGLVPSPAVITPGYLHQVSPPGSPAPYPREDIPQYVAVPPIHPVLNGDVESLSYNNELKIDEESESEEEKEEREGPEMSHSYSFDSRESSPSQHTVVPNNATEERNGTANDTDHIPPNVPRRSIGDHEIDEPPLHQVAIDTLQTVQANKSLLLLCYKEVKKPGREFSSLFQKIRCLQGSTESKVRFLKDIIQEALRFKRHSLAKLLTNSIDELANGVMLPNHSSTLQTLNNSSRNIVLNGHNR